MKGLTDVFGVMMVEIVVVPVMMTTTHASQPDQQACAIAWRPRCKFPWPPDAASAMASASLALRRHSSAVDIMPARPIGQP